MSRAVNAIGLILLGAIAAGGGAAFFLYQANTDRLALITKAEESRLIADEATRSGRTVTDEANRKLDAASEEITKAQTRIRTLEDERDMMNAADPLTKPRTIATWKEWINVAQGFTVRLPSSVPEPDNDERGLNAGFIVIKPFDASAPSTVDKIYVVDGHLLLGTYVADSAWVYQVVLDGKATHTIVTQSSRTVTEKTILDALSTLTFRDQ